MNPYTVTGLAFGTVAAVLFDLYGVNLVAIACAAFSLAAFLVVAFDRYAAIRKVNAEWKIHPKI